MIIPAIPEEDPLCFHVHSVNHRALQVFGDNQALIQMLNLDQKFDSHADHITTATHRIGTMWQREVISLRTADQKFFVHIPRK